MKGSAQKDFLLETDSSAEKDLQTDQESLGASLLRLVADLEIEEVGMAPGLSHETIAARASLPSGASETGGFLRGADSFPSPFGHVLRKAGTQRRQSGARHVPDNNDGQQEHIGIEARGRGSAMMFDNGSAEAIFGQGNTSQPLSSKTQKGVGKDMANSKGAAPDGKTEKEAWASRDRNLEDDFQDTQSILTEDGTQSLLEQVEGGAAEAAKHSPGHALRVAQRKPAREKLGLSSACA